MRTISILPSAIIDIAKMQLFYERIEIGLGHTFYDYIVAEIEKLSETAGIDEIHFGYYRALANRFHQNIYYKINGDSVVIWRVLDQRFNPKRIVSALLDS